MNRLTFVYLIRCSTPRGERMGLDGRQRFAAVAADSAVTSERVGQSIKNMNINSQINDKMINVHPKRTNFTSACIGTDFIFYKTKWAITWGVPMLRLLSIRLGG